MQFEVARIRADLRSMQALGFQYIGCGSHRIYLGELRTFSPSKRKPSHLFGPYARADRTKLRQLLSGRKHAAAKHPSISMRQEVRVPLDV